MFVKFIAQMNGCQDGRSQPVLGYWSFLASKRWPVTWRGGNGYFARWHYFTHP